MKKLLLAVIIAHAAAKRNSPNHTPKKPNIILLVFDDQVKYDILM